MTKTMTPVGPTGTFRGGYIIRRQICVFRLFRAFRVPALVFCTKKKRTFLSLLFSVSCCCFGHAKNLGASLEGQHTQRSNPLNSNQRSDIKGAP